MYCCGSSGYVRTRCVNSNGLIKNGSTGLRSRPAVRACWAASSPVPVTQASQDWLSEINQLYCWGDMACADTSKWSAAMTMVPAMKIKPAAGPEGAPESKKKEQSRDDKERNRLINARMRVYRNRVHEIMEQFKKGGLAEKTSSFLADPEPSVQRMERLAGELTAGMEGSSKASQKKIVLLTETMVGYWLDKVSLKKGSKASLDELNELTARTGVKLADAKQFYQQWDPGDIF